MHTIYLGNSENVPNNEKKKNEKTYILYTPKISLVKSSLNPR